MCKYHLVPALKKFGIECESPTHNFSRDIHVVTKKSSECLSAQAPGAGTSKGH